MCSGEVGRPLNCRTGLARQSKFQTYAQIGFAEEMALSQRKIEQMPDADAAIKAKLLACRCNQKEKTSNREKQFFLVIKNR